jgi:hypothetical protein
MIFASDGCIPFFKNKVSREATKCPNCQEWLSAMDAAQNVANAQVNTVAATDSVKGNLAKLGPLEIAIVVLLAMIGIGLL